MPFIACIGGVLSENVHYDPLPIKDLIDPSMSNWCHHAPYLLKQGRVVWWNPKAAQEEVSLSYNNNNRNTSL